jgi:putative oxidoreductase
MTFERIAIAAGRTLLASLFITAGLMFFRSPDFAFAESVITAHGLPAARAMLICTMILQLGCGGLMLINWHARWAALGLLVWLVPATMLFHAFWAAPPEQVANQTFHFLKNISVAGALLLVAGASPTHSPVLNPSSRVRSDSLDAAP